MAGSNLYLTYKKGGGSVLGDVSGEGVIKTFMYISD